MMNVQVLVFLLAALYLVSVVACYAVSLHAMRSWHRAYWRQVPVSRLAAWHPILARQGLAQGIPLRAGCDQDWVIIQRWCLLPVLNLALALGVPAAAAGEALLVGVLASIASLPRQGQHRTS